MNRVRRNAQRTRLARAALLLFSAFGVAAYIACSDDPTRYQPLDNNPQKSGNVVAGSVRDGTTGVKGAVVSIEELTNGVPATALALKEQPELAGKLDKRPDASDELRRVTLTDANGRFAFDRMPAGEYAISVRANNHLGAFEGVLVPPPTTALDTIIVDVNLTPTGTFSGVATLENGTTHSNTVVYAEGTSYVAVTDPFGAYAITDVPVGTYDIRATHSHYLDDTENGTLTFAGQNLGLLAMLLKLDNNIPPVATITIPVQTMVAGSPITFTSSGSDADGTVVQYEWDFENDGTMDSASGSPGNTSHTYASPGNYTVKLRVTDNQGAIGLDAANISVGLAAIYMATTGVDTNPGTQAQPVLTLVKAYQLAVANTATIIKAQAGIYSQVPAFIGGINIEGGHDVSWVPNIGYTTFQVGTARATANSITTATTISRVEIQTTNAAAGSNSIAMYSNGSSLALVFDTCIFRASNAGQAGPNGFAGPNGQNGGAGTGGGNGACDAPGPGGSGGPGGISPAGCPGGTGGAGAFSGGSGGPGQQGGCSGGFLGNGGFAGDPGQWGGNGGPGTNGTVGANGSASNPTGSIVGSDWAPANGGAGVAGTNGLGGGGGGGGGGQTCTFCTSGPGNGGGGGGGGATGGGAGGAGFSGFGSIAVLLNNSSPTFQGCSFYTLGGTGGRLGGYGGFGGIGGGGGLGGSVCTSEVGKGGNGGVGGNGGGAGAGAGGSGGPSVGIMRANGSVPSLSGNSYTIGVPGGGGTGGTRGDGGPAAPSGASGLNGSVVTI